MNQETSPLSIPEYSKSWEELDETEKAKEIIRMQVYAAMIDRLDQNIGRLIHKLDRVNRLENTVIFLKYAGYVSQLPCIDFTSCLVGNRIEREDPLLFQFNKGQAIIEGNWKLVKKSQGIIGDVHIYFNCFAI